MQLENAIKFKGNNLKIIKLGMFLQKNQKFIFSASGHGWWGSLIEPRGGNKCLKIIDWATITDCNGTYYVICEKG